MIGEIAALVVATAAANQPLRCDQPETQIAMTMCADQSYRRSDGELNRIWPQVVARARRLDRANAVRFGSRPNAYSSLLAAQRAWLTYRDNHCRVAGYDALGGSMESMLVSHCLTDLTENRIEELRSALQGMD
jgi:uncharacterized protein YecT (DUF1311 family)